MKYQFVFALFFAVSAYGNCPQANGDYQLFNISRTSNETREAYDYSQFVSEMDFFQKIVVSTFTTGPNTNYRFVDEDYEIDVAIVADGQDHYFVGPGDASDDYLFRRYRAICDQNVLIVEEEGAHNDLTDKRDYTYKTITRLSVNADEVMQLDSSSEQTLTDGLLFRTSTLKTQYRK